MKGPVVRSNTKNAKSRVHQSQIMCYLFTTLGMRYLCTTHSCPLVVWVGITLLHVIGNQISNIFLHGTNLHEHTGYNWRARISIRVRESTLTETRAELICENPVRLSSTVKSFTQTEWRRVQRLLQTPPRRIQIDSHSSLQKSTLVELIIVLFSTCTTSLLM